MARKMDGGTNCAPPKASVKNPKGTKPAKAKSGGDAKFQKY